MKTFASLMQSQANMANSAHDSAYDSRCGHMCTRMQIHTDVNVQKTKVAILTDEIIGDYFYYF